MPSEAFQRFQSECEARLKDNRHYQLYLASARNATAREVIETIALCFYIEGRLDERGGGAYQKAEAEFQRTYEQTDGASDKHNWTREQIADSQEEKLGYVTVVENTAQIPLDHSTVRG